jgi:hypothetical protein
MAKVLLTLIRVKWVPDLFLGLKRQKLGVDHTPPYSVKAEGRLELSRVFLSGLHGLFYG